MARLAFYSLLDQLRATYDNDIARLEAQLDKIGAPLSPAKTNHRPTAHFAQQIPQPLNPILGDSGDSAAWDTEDGNVDFSYATFSPSADKTALRHITACSQFQLASTSPAYHERCSGSMSTATTSGTSSNMYYRVAPVLSKFAASFGKKTTSGIRADDPDGRLVAALNTEEMSEAFTIGVAAPAGAFSPNPTDGEKAVRAPDSTKPKVLGAACQQGRPSALFNSADRAGRASYRVHLNEQSDSRDSRDGVTGGFSSSAATGGFSSSVETAKKDRTVTIRGVNSVTSDRPPNQSSSALSLPGSTTPDSGLSAQGRTLSSGLSRGTKPVKIASSRISSTVGTMSNFLNPLGSAVRKSIRPGTARWKLQALITSPWFESGFAAVIMVNAFVMAAELQYNGMQVGFEIAYPRCTRPAENAWPHARVVFDVLEWIFGGLFAIEMFMKMAVQLCSFFTCPWNWIDFLVVALFCIEAIAADLMPFNLQFVRLLRLARLGRLLRLVRTFQAFDALYLISRSLGGSFKILFWALAVMFVIQLAFGLMISQILHVVYFEDSSHDIAAQRKVYEYFGTWSRSMVSMLEITLANWPPICRLLAEEVSEWFFIFSVAHKLTIGFAVVSVINGVFMQETFKVAATDDHIMVRRKHKAQQQHAAKMKLLFKKLDRSNTGKANFEDFMYITRNDEVRAWLAAQDLNLHEKDLHNLFVLCDCDQDGYITSDELVKGIGCLKGSATSLDLRSLMQHFGAAGKLPHRKMGHAIERSNSFHSAFTPKSCLVSGKASFDHS